MAKPTKKTEPAKAQTEKFFAGRGGRKTATAQARVFASGSGITVNGKDYKEYFKTVRHQQMVAAPLQVAGVTVGVSVKVVGSGVSGQAGAVRHGISQALVSFDKDLKKKLKREGFLTRDARVVERKKYGLKKARRAPQWAKR